MLDLNIYKLIGKINTLVSQSTTSDEAIKKSIKLIVDSKMADYAVLWYLDEKNALFHPFYWLTPTDLSSVSLSASEGVVSETLKNEKTILFDNVSGKDETLSKIINDLVVSDLVGIPFAFGSESKGVLTIFKKTNKFSEDEIETFKILVLLIDELIKEKYINAEWVNKNKIMSVVNIEKEFTSGGVITKVLKGINFDIFEGEFLCLLGESGCGKSTLLNLIGGMDKATSGDIFYFNRNISKMDEKELTEYRRNNIGFIFQNYNLMPNLTAKENLDLIGELVKEPKDSTEILEMVGLSDKKGNYPSQLSGGQQQRVSIGRALIKNPKLILADEPTAALDYSTSIEVLEALENVVKHKTTLVMVTHNEEIAKMADRIIRFRNGKIYEVTINNHKANAKDLIW